MENSLNAQIGMRICRLREKRKMTTIDLSKKVGISQAQISRLENGKQGFRTVTLSKIAEALGVTLPYLLPERDQLVEEALVHPAFKEAVHQAAKDFLSGSQTTLIVPSVP